MKIGRKMPADILFGDLILRLKKLGKKSFENECLDNILHACGVDYDYNYVLKD